jgi:nucleotide-binding universal stress UspA family protein
MMDHVLIGVDGSEDSRTALRWGVGLADTLGSPVHVTRAWQYPSDAILSVGRLQLPTAEVATARIESELQALLDETLAGRATEVDVEVARGPATGVLLRAAESEPVTVVVGSRGLGGFKGLLLGSVGRQLAEHAHCPVTIVRVSEPLAPFRLRTVVAGHDGSPNAARAVEVAAELAVKAGAELVVASAAPPAAGERLRSGEPRTHLAARRDLVEDWCAPLRASGIEYRTAVVEGDARSALLEIAADRHADLLVVGSRGRGPVAKLLLGSVASSLAQHGTLPVTIVPHRG